MKMKIQQNAGLIGVLAAVSWCSVAAAAPIHVIVNGAPVTFTDQQPTSVNNHVLVPLRGVLEAMGAHVQWNPAAQAVTASRGATTVQLAVGSLDASLNGSPIALEVPAQMIGGRVMVPLRFVSEALGAEVHWTDFSQTATIQTAAQTSPIENSNAGVPVAPVSQVPVVSVQPTPTVRPGSGLSGILTSALPTIPGTTRLQVPVSPGQIPIATDVAVSDFTVNGAGPFHPGDLVNVQLKGTPGGKAIFTIGGTATSTPMLETTPGNYSGSYKVPAGAKGENVSVVGRLAKNGASSPLVQAATPVTFLSLPPQLSQMQPAGGSTTSNQKQTIYAVFSPGSSAVNPASAQLIVNGQDVTPQTTVGPVFVTYTPTQDYPAGPVSVKLSLGDTAGQTAVKAWSFTVKPHEGIKSLVDTAAGPLKTGNDLKVTLTGDPGGQAWFSIPFVTDRQPMFEQKPGIYAGNYLVGAKDFGYNVNVIGHLDIGGAHFTEKSAAPVVIWSRAVIQPVITSPAPNSLVKGSMKVVGSVDPDSKVDVTITFKQSLLGLFGTSGLVSQETVTSDTQGHFTTKDIPLGGVLGTSAGVTYTVSVVSTNPAGDKSQPTILNLRS
ncbi:MAG: copper amine oxidase N-terminal domain-containing protein [Armatimonadota bacterium]|nr:copper amine oxidase N-terminal domain-containing protein [Armatimonadota bacterium]